MSLDKPFSSLSVKQQRAILHGTADSWIALPSGVRFQYKGIFPSLDEATRVSMAYRQKLDHLVTEIPCES